MENPPFLLLVPLLILEEMGSEIHPRWLCYTLPYAWYAISRLGRLSVGILQGCELAGLDG